MPALEAFAVAFGLINIVLIIRRSVWNYPFGIAMVALYARVFWGAHLFSDAGLQVFFLLVQLYGWVAWARNRGEDDAVVVRKLGQPSWLLGASASVVLTIVWGTIMAQMTAASFPYWDAAIAILSIVAQFLMTWRYVENWWWWIVVDVMSMGLYAAKGLWLTAGLYAVFLSLAVIGLLQWQRHSRKATM